MKSALFGAEADDVSHQVLIYVLCTIGLSSESVCIFSVNFNRHIN